MDCKKFDWNRLLCQQAMAGKAWKLETWIHYKDVIHSIVQKQTKWGQNKSMETTYAYISPIKALTLSSSSPQRGNLRSICLYCFWGNLIKCIKSIFSTTSNYILHCLHSHKMVWLVLMVLHFTIIWMLLDSLSVRI